MKSQQIRRKRKKRGDKRICNKKGKQIDRENEVKEEGEEEEKEKDKGSESLEKYERRSQRNGEAESAEDLGAVGSPRGTVLRPTDVWTCPNTVPIPTPAMGQLASLPCERHGNG
ncbi:hypothetical protein Pmani_039792 [Petrolisthes manimaculis]|uniref:Uncharacterized protein n=1 Tax=Petrolisthes manimaculis TaxID=1843537 RepID=A0AAE1NBU8_9EUCA|nr:hypothetical protein Pmani_039792 [Petrolisthes manimaculis]